MKQIADGLVSGHTAATVVLLFRELYPTINVETWVFVFVFVFFFSEMLRGFFLYCFVFLLLKFGSLGDFTATILFPLFPGEIARTSYLCVWSASIVGPYTLGIYCS